jgi:hypothetical protein
MKEKMYVNMGRFKWVDLLSVGENEFDVEFDDWYAGIELGMAHEPRDTRALSCRSNGSGAAAAGRGSCAWHRPRASGRTAQTVKSLAHHDQTWISADKV